MNGCCPREVHEAARRSAAAFDEQVDDVVDWGEEAGIVSGPCRNPECRSSIGFGRDEWLAYIAAKERAA